MFISKKYISVIEVQLFSPFTPNRHYFGKTIKFHVPFGPFHCAKLNIIFMCLLALFNVQNFKKSFRVDPELLGCIIILGRNGSFTPTRYFSRKNIKFDLPFGPFYCAKLKKNWIQSYEVKPFSCKKWSICPNDIFFPKKPLN